MTINECAGINSRRAMDSKLVSAVGRLSQDIGSSTQRPGIKREKWAVTALIHVREIE